MTPTPPAATADADTSPVVRKPILVALAKAVAGGLLGLLGVDLCVTWSDWGQAAGSDAWEPHETVAWLPREGRWNDNIRVNSLHLRGAELPDDAPATEVRVLVTGASRMWGKGVPEEHTWTPILEDLLVEEFATDLRVLNGAVMAYSAVQACRRAEMLLPEVEPDLVIVVFSPNAQGMLDTSSARAITRVGERLVPERVLEGWPVFLHPTIAAVREQCMLSGIYTRQQAKYQAGNEDRDLDIQRWILSERPDEPDVQEMLDRTLSEIAALIQTARREGFKLRFIVLPELSQSSQKSWEWYTRHFVHQSAPLPSSPRTEPTDLLSALIEERGGRVWNMFEEGEVVGSDRRKYLLGGQEGETKDDQHWTAEGHELMARSMFRRIRDEGQIPALVERRASGPR